MEALFDQQDDYKNKKTFQNGKIQNMKSKKLSAKIFKPSEPKQFKTRTCFHSKLIHFSLHPRPGLL